MVDNLNFMIFANMYPELNLPQATLRIENGKVWDILRKKNLKVTPEEWVRQHFIHFLIDHRQFPAGLMISEYKVDYAGKAVRADIVVFNNDHKTQVIIECKAPKIKLTENTFYQVAKYARVLNPKMVILTNGLMHICAYILENGDIQYLKGIPNYCDI